MKGIYLAACRAYHPNYDLDYNDIKKGYHINIIGDMLTVNLENYDYIIATPPCNYYSKCNYRRETSKYAQETKHLLPSIINKCIETKKPFIIENVRNYKIMKEILISAQVNGCFVYEYGRHTYITNIMFNPTNCKQRQDFYNHGYRIKYGDEQSKYNQGGYNVHNVIEYWLSIINS